MNRLVERALLGIPGSKLLNNQHTYGFNFLKSWKNQNTRRGFQPVVRFRLPFLGLVSTLHEKSALVKNGFKEKELENREDFFRFNGGLFFLVFPSLKAVLSYYYFNQLTGVATRLLCVLHFPPPLGPEKASNECLREDPAVRSSYFPSSIRVKTCTRLLPRSAMNTFPFASRQMSEG